MGNRLLVRRALLSIVTVAALLDAGFVRSQPVAADEVMAVVFDPALSDVLYLGTFGNGVYKSTDAGVSWSPVNVGIISDAIWGPTIAVDPLDTTVVYAGVGSRVYKSTSGGGSWRQTLVSSTGAFFSVSLDPEDRETLYATTYAGIYKSMSAAESWESLNFPPFSDLVLALAIARDSVQNRQVYAGLQRRAILRSTDEENWRDDGLGCLLAFVIAVDRERNIPYAGACGCGNPGGVYKRLESGWISTGPISGGEGRCIRTIAIDSQNPDILYAGASFLPGPPGRGAYKSVDAGEEWQGIGLNEYRVNSLAVDPRDTDIIYAGTSFGLFKSTNAGVDWKRIF